MIAKIKLHLKFPFIEPYKVKELIYRSFFVDFSFNNREHRLNKHDEEDSKDVIGK